MENNKISTIPEYDKQMKKWKFSELLADDVVRERWEKVKKYFFLRESSYDMTNRCNMRCEGCYYFEGEKQYAKENSNPEAWRSLMKAEKARGITYAVLAGAEPSMVPELLEACYSEIPLGCIATNGLKRISEAVGYKIHISVWGNDETSLRVRSTKNLLSKQIENYQSDPRAVFVYTFTHDNINEIYDVMDSIVAKGCKITFNVFSSPVGYKGSLRLDKDCLAKTRNVMMDVMLRYPNNVLFSPYNAAAHTHQYGLHELFDCLYPRKNPSVDVGLGRSFRQYHADLTWNREMACCVPDTDCDECRHYAAGSAVVTARLYRHVTDPDLFKSWLDYVNTYLAVWMMGYEKGDTLCSKVIEPPLKYS